MVLRLLLALATTAAETCPDADRRAGAAIPRVLYQTSKLEREDVPFPRLHGPFADAYEVQYFDDDAAAALVETHMDAPVFARFQALSGAHRADLWRYCVLWLRGGVYIDIKTRLLRPLEEVFPSVLDKTTWYAVACNDGFCIYNGIIATPPRNPVLKRLIDFIVESEAFPGKVGDDGEKMNLYRMYINHFGATVREEFGLRHRETLAAGIYENCQSRLVLYKETCSVRPAFHPDFGTERECRNFTAFDRYGRCCNLYGTPPPDGPVSEVSRLRQARDFTQEPLLVVRDEHYDGRGFGLAERRARRDARRDGHVLGSRV